MEIKSIQQASLVKRCFAMIIDLFFVASLFLLTYLPATEGLFDYGFGVNETLLKAKKMQVESGLYVDRSENKDLSSVTIIGGTMLVDENEYFKFNCHELYFDALYKFYYESPYKDEAIRFHLDEIEITEKDLNKWFNENVLYINQDPDFDIFYLESNNIYDSPLNAKIKEEITFDGEKFKKKSEIVSENQPYIIALCKIFTDTTVHQGSYHVAINDLLNTKEYTEIYKKLERIARYEAYISLALAGTVYFLIIPLCFKNGETFGMKFLSLGLTDLNGYQVLKKQIFLKYLFLFVEAFINMFTFFLFYLIDYLIIVFTKNHRSIGDYLGATMMIDTKNSVWFKDQETESRLIKGIENNLNKGHKDWEEKKNVDIKE